MPASAPTVLFLSGDVMTGRGIDQILAHPGDSRIYEPFVRDAREYVALAERINGPIPRPVEPGYIWGDALPLLAQGAPMARIINLETSITARGHPWPKGINYRMHPANTSCLTVAQIDCCVLANNHVLDWDQEGFADTLRALDEAGIAYAGAGAGDMEAAVPSAIPLTDGSRLLVFAGGFESSGIPTLWHAGPGRPGVNLLPDLGMATTDAVAHQVRQWKRAGDIAVYSIHWGPNWGYTVRDEQRRFAHALIDEAGIDVVHGHSSHHPMGLEIHRGHPILYGAGDLINDYEGIAGYERFRGELALLYFLSLDAETRRVCDWWLVPMRRRRFRLERAGAEDILWLQATLDRESRRWGTGVRMEEEGRLRVIL